MKYNRKVNALRRTWLSLTARNDRNGLFVYESDTDMITVSSTAAGSCGFRNILTSLGQPYTKNGVQYLVQNVG